MRGDEMNTQNVGYKIICQPCVAEVIITNGYNGVEPIEVYTSYKNSWAGTSSIELNI